MAVVLHRSKRGPPAQRRASRAAEQGDRPRRADPGAFRLAADVLLYRLAVSERVRQRDIRRRAWLMEQVDADRLQSDPGLSEERNSYGRISGLFDRLRSR